MVAIAVTQDGTPLELDDVQGLVATGFGKLKWAKWVLLQFPTGQHGAQAWLSELLPEVTRSSDTPPGSALQVALTAPGLAALGLPAGVFDGLSREFTEGISTPVRQRVLGDLGRHRPEDWRWGGPFNPPVHGLLMVYAADESGLTARIQHHTERCRAHGLELVETLNCQELQSDREHFGFRDGISQPGIDGIRGGSADSPLPPGEVLLGHDNGYGERSTSPTLPAALDPSGLLRPISDGRVDFGCNGSYLVLRQLQQDPVAFWRYMDAQTRNADGTPNPAGRVALAAKIMGRWPGGAPLVLSPDADDSALAGANDFGYHDIDPHGYRCPLGAHVRRANPRDTLGTAPGSAKAVKLSELHRIVRRGRTYGSMLDTDPEQILQGDPQDSERGLFFLCLNASIRRQFEFIQQTWLNNEKFAGLHESVDAVAGSSPSEPASSGTSFIVQRIPVRSRLRDVPSFVRVRGGGYFLLPSLRALRFLASR